MAKSDGEDKNTTKTEQAEPELRPFYYPDHDVTVMAADHDSAAKALEKTLETIKQAKAENGDQE